MAASACSVPPLMCLPIAPEIMPAMPARPTSHAASSTVCRPPPSSSARMLRTFVPRMMPPVKAASMRSMGTVLTSCMHFLPRNAMVTSLVTTPPDSDTFLTDLVPLQYLGSPSRSEIIRQTSSGGARMRASARTDTMPPPRPH